MGETFLKVLWIVLILLAIAMSVAAPLYLIIISAFLSFCIFSLKKPILSICLYIIIVPFSNTTQLAGSIRGLGGLPVIFAFVILCCMFYVLNNAKFDLPKKDAFFFITFILLIIISAVRSIPYLNQVISNGTPIPLSWYGYFNFSVFAPVLMFFPTVLISGFILDKIEIAKVIKAVMLSMLALSSALIWQYLFLVPDKTNFEVVRETFSSVMNMHGNSIANFYILGFTMVFAYFINKKDLLSAITLLLSVVSVLILYSRTAYFVILISVIAFLVLTDRKKAIPVFAAVLFIGLLLTPPIVKERALTGIISNSGNYESAGNVISAGRLNYIWQPLVLELLNKPAVLVFGGGSYYFFNTDTQKNIPFYIDQPHNVYLEIIVITGLVGLIFMLIFFARLIRKFYYEKNTITDKFYRDLLTAILVSVAAYLIRGLSDASLFPNQGNTLLWIVLGIGISIVKSEKLLNIKFISFSSEG